jgi:alpha-L-arabinofuranosidase
VTPKVDVNQLADWVKGLGPQARLIVTTNVGTGSRLRATGPNGALREEDVAAGAREAAEWVRYFNVQRGLGVKYWEVGNEYGPWAAEIGGHIQDTSSQGWRWMTAKDYATIFRTYAKAMKAVDPSIQVCGPVGFLTAPADAMGRGNWIESFLAEAGDYVDVLDIHFYETGGYFVEYMAAPQLISQHVARLRAMLQPYEAKRGRSIPIAISEWGDYLDHFSVGSALFVADALGEIAASGVEWANMWDLGGPEHGLIRDYGRGPEPNGRYWTQYLWAQHAGTTLVHSTLGELSRARLAVHATRLADGSLTLLVINKDPEVDLAVPVQVANYTPQAQAEVLVWGEQQYQWDRAAKRPVRNTGPVVATAPVAQNFSYVFPRASVTLIKMKPA